jgi:threonine/homoserine/homoserine lactone efflux protein
MLSYILQGLTVGFGAGIQPGPYQAYIVSESLHRGWRKTLIAAFAPLVSDGPIVAAILLLLTNLPGWFTRALALAGGGFLLYLAWGAYRSWRDFSPAPPDGGSGSLLRAASMNLLSPGPYIFWSTVNGPILLGAWKQAPAFGLGFVVTFYVVMIAINAAVILLTGLAAQSGDRVRRGLLGISALTLAGFGLFQLWRGIWG